MQRNEIRDPRGNLLFYSEIRAGKREVRDAVGRLLGSVGQGQTRDAFGRLVAEGEDPALLYEGRGNDL